MDYVLVYAQRGDDVQMIRKNRPAWMAGKLNLPGGKIEKDETPGVAAARELSEETGLLAGSVEQMGIIHIDDGKIYCFRALDCVKEDDRCAEETEEIGWYAIDTILKDSTLMPNLRLIIPLVSSGIGGWDLVDRYTDAEASYLNLRLERVQ